MKATIIFTTIGCVIIALGLFSIGVFFHDSIYEPEKESAIPEIKKENITWIIPVYGSDTLVHFHLSDTAYYKYLKLKFVGAERPAKLHMHYRVNDSIWRKVILTY